MRKLLCLLGMPLALTACAELPEGQVTYYEPKASAKVTVTQTVACDAAHKNLFAASTATVSPTYQADPTRKRVFALKTLNGNFTDGDATFGLTTDGRLKSLNADQTGNGEAVVKAAMALAVVPTLSAPLVDDPTADACKAIMAWAGGDAKPVTLTYEVDLEPSDLVQKTFSFDAAQPSALYATLKKSLPTLQGAIEVVTPAAPFTASGLPTDTNDQTVIWVTNTRLITIDVMSKSGDAPATSAGKTTVVVPTTGDYALPVPRSILFGKEGMSLAIDESGAVTSLGYTRTNGSASAINAATDALTQSDEARSNILKGKADLIAQQTRLVQCEADPTNCK